MPPNPELRARADRVASSAPSAPLARRYRALIEAEAGLEAAHAEALDAVAELEEALREVRDRTDDLAAELVSLPWDALASAPVSNRPDSDAAGPDPAARVAALRARLGAVVDRARRQVGVAQAMRPLAGAGHLAATTGAGAGAGATPLAGLPHARPGMAAARAAALLTQPMLHSGPLGAGFGVGNARGVARAMIEHVERHAPPSASLAPTDHKEPR